MRIRRLACSFCGTSAARATRLIAGPRVFICDACVARCNQILAEQPPGASVAPAVGPPARLRWWRRLRAWWAPPRASAASTA